MRVTRQIGQSFPSLTRRLVRVDRVVRRFIDGIAASVAVTAASAMATTAPVAITASGLAVAAMATVPAAGLGCVWPTTVGEAGRLV